MKRLTSGYNSTTELFETIKSMSTGAMRAINNDFFLLSDGFIKSNDKLEEMKRRISETGATIISHPEAFLKVLIYTKLNRTMSTSIEKTYLGLLKIGQVKSEEEWKNYLNENELKLLKPNTPRPPVFELLNPTIILVCTEQEAKVGIPIFRIIDKLSQESHVSIAIRPSDLETYFINSDEILFNLDKQLKNPVTNYRDYILLSERKEEKEEMARYLLEHGATNVIENFMDPHLVIEDFGLCAVVVSDEILSETGCEKIYFELKLARRAEFILYSELVGAVNELRHLKPIEMNRLKHLFTSSDLVIEARTLSRHMTSVDPSFQSITISSLEQLSTILPNEVFFNALKFLPVDEILNNFSLTNKLARKMSFQDHLWKDICLIYAKNYEFLTPFRNEEVLRKTKLPHYYLFRNVINPIIIDYKMVLTHINSKLKGHEDIAQFNLQRFNQLLSTGLYIQQSVCNEDTIAVGTTKIFGNPDFPPALHQSAICKRNLVLQLNIDELKEKGIGVLSIENSPIKHLFPESGILYFFDNGIVLHYNGAISDLERVASNKKMCSSVSFYEALVVPRRSEILFSCSSGFHNLLLPNSEDFGVDTYSMDEVFSQLIHPKFHKDVEGLFGTFSCFTEGAWYRTGDEDDDRFISLDNYIDLGSIICPLYQFSCQSELFGYALVTQEGNYQTMWKSTSNAPNVFVLDPCYFGNFGREIPSKFKKDFKHLANQFISSSDDESIGRKGNY